MAKKAFISWGGWEGHEPRETAELFAGVLAEEGFAVTLRDSLEPLADRAFLEEMDLIVPVWTMSTIAPEQEAGLLRAIKKGTGCAGWHGGEEGADLLGVVCVIDREASGRKNLTDIGLDMHALFTRTQLENTDG